jgi:endonuclease VIII
MPEGDTIFRAARTLQRALGGRTVVSFETQLPRLARVDEDAPIAGRTIESVWAVGKHLLIEFSGDLVLRSHLRMNGSWHLYRRGERWRRRRDDMRVVIATDEFEAVGFRLPVAEFVKKSSLAAVSEISSLGPDLLGQNFDREAAVRRILARTTLSIAEALLDQRAMAGVGNVFKSEVLFATRVSPFAKVSDLGGDAIGRIVDEARRQLAANVFDPASDDRIAGLRERRTTRRADPRASLWVYGRRGEPCRRCGSPVERRLQGADARVTYWCPVCQP